MRNPFVPDLTPINIPGFSRSSGMNVFLFSGVADQRFALQSNTNLLIWSGES